MGSFVVGVFTDSDEGEDVLEGLEVEDVLEGVDLAKAAAKEEMSSCCDCSVNEELGLLEGIGGASNIPQMDWCIKYCDSGNNFVVMSHAWATELLYTWLQTSQGIMLSMIGAFVAFGLESKVDGELEAEDFRAKLLKRMYLFASFGFRVILNTSLIISSSMS